MDLSFSKNAVTILTQWFRRSANVTTNVKEDVRRPPYPCTKIDTLPSASPEDEGIESARILKYYERLCREPAIKMQTVIIARNGRILSRGHFYPYSTDIWHVSYSLAKSLTGLAVGLLYDDGLISLDDKLIDIIKDVPPAARLNHRTTTVRHLLTMQTGVIFNEAGAITETDWVRAYLESGLKFRPGTSFEYNSMNTYMLAAIVKTVSGKGVLELLKDRVFTPMGIKNIYWEKCPKGIEKGGWGIYYYPDDVLKIGLLYLNGGVWEGQRLISEKWIAESTKKQTASPAETGIYDYGYQIWCKEDRSTYLFNGMFGQNLIVFPKTNIMIATTAGIDETFQNSPLYTITEKFFGTPYRPRAHLDPAPDELVRLREAEKNLVMENSDAFLYKDASGCASFAKLNGTYTVSAADGTGLSIMPELYQLVHNNFAEGLRELELNIGADGGTLTTLEGGTKHRIPFGFGEAVPGCAVYGKESLLTSSFASVIDEDGKKKLRVTVCFPELPNIRYITIDGGDGAIDVRWAESPGYDFLQVMIDRTVLGKIAVDKRAKAAGADFLAKRVRFFIEPTVSMTKK
ncbi:MAG: serine hydrolase [Clostridia bacterium]|nr:serine hydrolase [Clostridia bacterium]